MSTLKKAYTNSWVSQEPVVSIDVYPSVMQVSTASPAVVNALVSEASEGEPGVPNIYIDTLQISPTGNFNGAYGSEGENINVLIQATGGLFGRSLPIVEKVIQEI